MKNITTFKLIEKTNPFKDNNTLFHYRDEKGRDVFFRDTNIPFSFSLHTGTHADFYNVRFLKIIVEEYINKGISQHDYKGGYDEAISTLKVRGIN